MALALLAFAVIMFLVTIVKLEDQAHRNGSHQTQGETNIEGLEFRPVAASENVYLPRPLTAIWRSRTSR